MSDQARFWRYLVDTLAHQRAVMLMIVVSSTGSSPGKAGAKMAVPLQGECYGTIGGGAVEHTLVKQARAGLTDDSWTTRLSRLQHHLSKTGQASGMICGGEQTVLLYRCRNGDRELYRQLAEACLNHMPVVLQLSPAGLGLNPLPEPASGCPLKFDRLSDDDWNYQETVGFCKQAYLIGGGHVSLALSRILATLDFDITVIDERPNLDTLDRNTDAHRKLTVPYRDISHAIPQGDQVFVFIMTHSHKTDEKVAEILLTKKVGYLGILGSRRKIAQLKANLSAKLPPEALQILHAPIGLPIHSHTPAEIAVSVAAELIQLVNSKERSLDNVTISSSDKAKSKTET
ncbi:MAG: XdhC family protein [Gammaproteobacteria bacterium]